MGARHGSFRVHALQGVAHRGGGGRLFRGGVASHRCEGRLLSGAPPLPAARPWGRATRPVFGVPRAQVVWAWGPSTCSTACALASRRCALWKWREGIPAGSSSCRCEGRLRSDTCPPPAARPRGRQAGSAAHVLWVRLCVRGGPALSLWRACPAGCAPRGWRDVISGGLISHRCERRLVSGRSPLGRPSPGGGRPGPVAQRALLQAGVARCGGGGRAFAGVEVPRAVVRGV